MDYNKYNSPIFFFVVNRFVFDSFKFKNARSYNKRIKFGHMIRLV